MSEKKLPFIPRLSIPFKRQLLPRDSVPLTMSAPPMICRYEGVVGSGMGFFPAWGPLAEDSATKLKRGQLNMCTVYGVLFSPHVAEICARLAGNFCQ